MEKQKRKKIVLSMQEKLNALRRLDKGETLQKVADDFGVGRRTVGDWRKNRSEIEKWCSSRVTDIDLKDRKTMKKSDFEQTSEALYIWFVQFRDKGVPISGPILKEKALHFQKKFQEGDEEFTASIGWLDRWKKRYGIRQLSICGEKLSSNFEGMAAFKKKFHALIELESLTGDQIFNCDETGLNYKLLPSKSLAAKSESAAPGYKRSKERVTILACSNATSNHKMELLMIGKSKNPRAFKGISKHALPVKYFNQKSAWMSSEIFKDWFFQEFVPSTEKFLRDNKLPRKALLLLDNAPSHPDDSELKDGDIRAMFLPPNVTALCQPMDQGVLETLKRNYRRNLLSTMIQEIEDGRDFISKLKAINLKDVSYWIASAWDKVGGQTIARSWNKLLGEDEETTENDPDEVHGTILPLVQRIPGCEDASLVEVGEWLSGDDQHEITDEEIVNLVNSNGAEDVEEPETVEPQKVPHKEGVKIFEAAIRYAEQQEEAHAVDIMMLQRWRDLAAKKRDSSERQTKITSFFRS